MVLVLLPVVFGFHQGAIGQGGAIAKQSTTSSNILDLMYSEMYVFSSLGFFRCPDPEQEGRIGNQWVPGKGHFQMERINVFEYGDGRQRVPCGRW